MFAEKEMKRMEIHRCVILAAGASTRLRPLTDTIPKCLLKVGEQTILERTIGHVLLAGIKEIAIVIGYQGEKIREFVKHHFPQLRIRFILNPNFAITNNAYSLLLAKKFLENKNGNGFSGLLLLDSDIFFSRDLLPFLLSVGTDNVVAVRVAGGHDEEEVRVARDSESNILSIGKNLAFHETYGESIGIEMFSHDMVARLYTILEQRVRSGLGRNEFYESSFQEMITHGARLKAVDVSDYPVREIDTKEDLELAERMRNV
jgi:choline kinase